MIEIPDIDSPTSRIYKWFGPRVNKEHLFYFNKRSLKAILEKAGFHVVYAKRIVWDGLNRPFIDNFIKLPLFSEIYALIHRLKGGFGGGPVSCAHPAGNAGNRELWPRHKGKDKKYFLAGLLGKVVFYLNRGDDLYTISRVK
jgi:hypothetical protein